MSNVYEYALIGRKPLGEAVRQACDGAERSTPKAILVIIPPTKRSVKRVLFDAKKAPEALIDWSSHGR